MADTMQSLRAMVYGETFAWMPLLSVFRPARLPRNRHMAHIFPLQCRNGITCLIMTDVAIISKIKESKILLDLGRRRVQG